MEPQNTEEIIKKHRRGLLKIWLDHGQNPYISSEAMPDKVRKYDARLTFINHKFLSNSISSYYYGVFVKINCHVFMIEYESVFY